MERDNEASTDMIDLGAATEATRGAWGDYSDEVLMQHMAGLTND